MSDREHVEILRQGANAWNLWQMKRRSSSGKELVCGDLSGADLRGAKLDHFNLGGVNLRGADLRKACLQNAFLGGADLSSCDLRQAIFYETGLNDAKLREARLDQAMLQASDLSRTDFTSSCLRRADLSFSDARRACFRYADMRKAHMDHSIFLDADFTAADMRGAYLVNAILNRSTLVDSDLSGASVYGIAAWDVNISGCIQEGLVITTGSPMITVDDLQVAQFIHLLLHNEGIRAAIEAITCKVVLILGSFIPERKAVLDALKAELRKMDLVAILFDFSPPASKDFTETVIMLAGMARFIVADLSSASSLPLELQAVVPHLMVPVVPLLKKGETHFGMFVDLQRKYNWVMDIVSYDSIDDLVRRMRSSVIQHALRKHDAIAQTKSDDAAMPRDRSNS